MTPAEVAALLTAVGTGIGGLAYMMNAGIWIFKKTPDQRAEEVKQDNSEIEHKIEDTGRPQ